MKQLRIVSYAINGRGMGHLVRQLAILRWTRRLCAFMGVKAQIWMMTTSEADTLARKEGVPALKMPSKAMLRDVGMEPHQYLSVARTWVMNAVTGLKPDVLLVDTFPGGSFGELVPVLETVPHRVLVARRVRPEFAEEETYRALIPLYDQVIVPDKHGVGPILIREKCELLPREAARRALGIPEGKKGIYVTLGGGGDLAASSTIPRLVEGLRAKGLHVVVGAGPLYQGAEIRGEGITWLSRYLSIELMNGLDCAVSACGYNTFHELMYAGVPTIFLPQSRIADDQEERARRAQAAGAGRVAGSVEEVFTMLENVGSASACCTLVPENGARHAAAALLSQVLPESDVQMALAAMTDEVLGVITELDSHTPESTRKAFELIRMLAGDLPSQRAKRRATLLELQDQGQPVEIGQEEKPDPGDRVRRYVNLCTGLQLRFDTALRLMSALRRKFPAAGGAELLAAAEQLLPVWARFDDWMGATTLLRAVPTQRTFPIESFATQMAEWCGTQEDLFMAVRAFSRLEGSGERTVAEVLHLLLREEVSA